TGLRRSLGRYVWHCERSNSSGCTIRMGQIVGVCSIFGDAYPYGLVVPFSEGVSTEVSLHCGCGLSDLGLKSIWVSWNKVLTSKEKGGLGVSSLFALNRALMFKWVWRFLNQRDSLWVRVIHAIHGVDGRISRAGNVGYTSIWCDIIKEMGRMPRSGIESKQWDHLLDSLEGVMLNPSKDRWSWDLNGLGEFSVASARRYIDNNRLPDISSKTRWIKEVPIKVNVHAWKNDSWIWKSLLDLRSEVRDNMIYKIGNGRKPSVWHDMWSDKPAMDTI
nr:RNA-directed DNA polymerase, eukaryota, reverse transcriptase zinc-binding domain protein [Tanacetum cinerariifolium]